MKGTSVVILAGGNSERLKLPKPFLPFDSHHTFMEKMVNEYFKFGCKKIIIVINKRYLDIDSLNRVKGENKIIIPNEHPERGRFYSLKLGAENLSDEEFCFIQNADNPFVDGSLLERLYNSRIKDGYVVPVYEGKRGHPILVGEKIILKIKSEKDLNLNIRYMLDDYMKTEVIADDDKVLANINSREDYKKYFNKDINLLKLFR